MGKSWMVDGEMSVMMMMISSKSPSQQGARMEFLVPNCGFWFRIAVSGGGGAVELYLGKAPNPRSF
jgi:hypothetical protein